MGKDWQMTGGATMDLEGLSPELKEKVLACKTTEELFELAKNEGMELTDDQLDAVSGGTIWYSCDHEECANYCARKDMKGYC